MTPVALEDFGIMTFVPPGVDSQGCVYLPIQIDVAEGAERCSRAVREANGDELVYADRLREAMQAMGFPPMSHHCSHSVATQIWKQNGEVEKKYGVTRPQGAEPESPTTTM